MFPDAKSRGAGPGPPDGGLGSPLAVAAAGPGWIAVDKPAGMSVHNDPGGDLVACLKRHLAEAPELAERCAFRPGAPIQPVHRLDRETSGLVLVALAPATVRVLMAAFAERRVGKTYLAVLHGILATPATVGLWEFPLAPGAGGRRHPAGPGPRQDARTRYRVLAQGNGFTLAACRPETGRKHQIRRHACLAGHPLAGDRRYGPPAWAAALERRCGFRRLALHALRLELMLPGESAPRALETGPPPPELLALVGRQMDPAAFCGGALGWPG